MKSLIIGVATLALLAGPALAQIEVSPLGRGGPEIQIGPNDRKDDRKDERRQTCRTETRVDQNGRVHTDRVCSERRRD